MRYLSVARVLGGILFLSAQGVRAEELAGIPEVGSYRGPMTNTYRQDFQNPKEKLGEITGTIHSVDRISGTIWVQGAKGSPMEFALETNTRLEDHHLQISLDDLLLGDGVIVRYNVDPRTINTIDRI